MFLLADPGKAMGLFPAEVRDGQFVRVIEAGADNAGVASAAAVTRHALLKDDDVSLRFKLPEKVGCPQAGKPHANDSDICIDPAGQWRTGSMLPGGEPEAGLFDRRHRGVDGAN